VREGFLTANGVRLHVVEEGEGPLVLLLHGFPESSYGWRHQLPYLAGRGFRAVAPDLRGYGTSDAPAGISAYDLDELARDVEALIGGLGAERAALVGHDWGATLAWHAAQRHPGRVARLVAIDGPPAAQFGRVLLRDPAQVVKSRYMFWFQVPGLAERWLRGERLKRWIRGWAGRKEAFTDEDLARYVETAERAGGLRGGLAWYRAARRRGPAMLRERTRVAAPTLVIWGGEDAILGRTLLEGLERFAAGPLRVEVVAGAGHFAPEEAPDEVNRLLGEFLSDFR
jgi:pimeloyl-ACP methyl ester carboxylesterase